MDSTLFKDSFSDQNPLSSVLRKKGGGLQKRSGACGTARQGPKKGFAYTGKICSVVYRREGSVNLTDPVTVLEPEIPRSTNVVRQILKLRFFRKDHSRRIVE